MIDFTSHVPRWYHEQMRLKLKMLGAPRIYS